ncbi:MAG: Uma2 family endonuclease [Cyanobacteria bacterium P01_H01_bin.15]
MIAVPHFINPTDYLNIERDSPIRHEYRRGLVYAMVGGTDNHDLITLNLLTLLNLHLRGSGCRAHSGNVKVNYQDEFYYYPDAFVTCEPSDRQDRYIKQSPKLIAEVLSPSTQAFDQGEKLADYKKLDSLKEYVLISQTSQRIECHRRSDNNIWETIVYEPGNRVSLASIDLKFAITEPYQDLYE